MIIEGKVVTAVGVYGEAVLPTQLRSAGVDLEDAEAAWKPRTLTSETTLKLHQDSTNASSARVSSGDARQFSGQTRRNGSQRAVSFYDLIYDRIHYDPASMNLGQLMNAQSRELQIWNAFFVPRTLQAVSGVDAGGIEITHGTLPRTLLPLQSVTMQVSAETEGPPSIDATFTFTWDNGSKEYRITGERLVVLAFEPSTVAPFTERLKWYGTVATGYSGYEQRMSLSDHPKISYDYVVQVLDAERHRLESCMWGWQSRVFAVPVWNSATLTSQRVFAGSLTLPVESTAHREFRADRLAVVFAGVEMYEVVEVASVGLDSLSLKKPLQRNWTKRVSVIPVRLMRMAREISYSSPVANFKQLSISLIGEAGESVDTTFQLPTYKGLPVIAESYDTKDGTSGTYERNMDWDDGEYSLPLAVDRSGVGTLKHTYQYTFESYAKAQQFKAFLSTLRGTQGEFWMSTWAPDMHLVQPIEAGALSFYVNEASRSNMYADMRGRKDLVILLRNGTVLYREIRGITPGGPNAVGAELVEVTEQFTSRITPAQVQSISYLSRSRFENEAFEFTWVTQEWASLTVSIKGLSDGV